MGIKKDLGPVAIPNVAFILAVTSNHVFVNI